MEARKIRRPVDEAQDVVVPVGADTQDVERLTREYVNTQSMATKVGKRLDEIKSVLSKIVDKSGQPDDKGSMWLPAGQHQLKREKRVSHSFDAEAAEKWARESGIWDDVKIVRETLDVERLIALGWQDPEIGAKVQEFHKEKVVWAFKVLEAKSYYDEGDWE